MIKPGVGPKVDWPNLVKGNAMKIRFVKDYPGHVVGDVVDASELSVGLAQGLINLGIAEKMPEEKVAAKKGDKE